MAYSKPAPAMSKGKSNIAAGKTVSMENTGGMGSSVTVRRIDNGFITSHSGTDGKGNYVCKEVFSKAAPAIKIPK